MKKYEYVVRDKYVIYKENKKQIGIYRVNNINGKCYIGSSSNLGTRLRIPFYKKQMHNKLKINNSIIYKALLKHGYDDFTL